MVIQADDVETRRISELAASIRAICGNIKRRLMAQSNGGDLTESQLAVLLRLERDGPASISALAKAEGMRPQSMGALLSGLDQAIPWTTK